MKPVFMRRLKDKVNPCSERHSNDKFTVRDTERDLELGNFIVQGL